MCLKFLTVQYNHNDNLVVHSSDIHFKVSAAQVTEVSQTSGVSPPEAQSLVGEGHLEAHWEREAHGRWPYTRQQKWDSGAETAMWANGGPKMQTSHLRKGFPWLILCLEKIHWVARVCSHVPEARGSHQSVQGLLERGNISPRCYPCPSWLSVLIQVSTGTEGKVAKDGHEQEWPSGNSLRICHRV